MLVASLGSMLDEAPGNRAGTTALTNEKIRNQALPPALCGGMVCIPRDLITNRGFSV